MTTYKYTDATNTVVHVIDDDGISRSSMLATLVPDGEAIEPYVPTPAELNAPILAQLAVIDQKKVRAMTDGILKNDKQRLQDLEAEAEALRLQLV